MTEVESYIVKDKENEVLGRLAELLAENGVEITQITVKGIDFVRDSSEYGFASGTIQIMDGTWIYIQVYESEYNDFKCYILDLGLELISEFISEMEPNEV